MEECKFKVGDEVQLYGKENHIVSEVSGNRFKIKNYGYWYLSDRDWELIRSAKTPHKHAELIIEFVKGNEVEMTKYSSSTMLCCWEHVTKLSDFDNINFEYRIKPEPKPDIVIEKYAFYQDTTHSQVYTQTPEAAGQPANIRFTVDAETKQIKSVEMI